MSTFKDFPVVDEAQVVLIAKALLQKFVFLLLTLISTFQICAINMRNATYDLAARVLQQCGNNLTLHVQYNPESKYI